MPPLPIDSIFAEMDAQGAAQRALEGSSSLQEAQLAIQGALDLAGPPEGLPDTISQMAMKLLVGRPLSFSLPKPDRNEARMPLFSAVARLWVLSVRSPASGSLREEATRIKADPRLAKIRPDEGSVQRMAVSLWLDALVLLSEGQRSHARRLWLRALDVGSAYGTDSHPVILWTYLASFLPRGRTQAPSLLAS